MTNRMQLHPGDAEPYLVRRRARIRRWTGRVLTSPLPTSISPERRRHLVEEAVELYWNELSWEQLTDEEMRGGSQLVERTFPGFLALVEGLLVTEAPPDSPVPATPRPDVVEEILGFLAGRCSVLEAGLTEGEVVTELELTTRLLDLVLYRLHALRDEEIDRLEIARLKGDE